MGEQKNAILAVVLSGAILFGWQYFFAPPVQPPLQPVMETETVDSESTAPTIGSTTSSKDDSTVIDTPINTNVKSYILSNDKHEYSINNNLVITESYLKNTNVNLTNIFQTKENNIVQFLVDGKFKKLFFSISQSADEKLLLKNSDLGLEGTIILNPNGKVLINLVSDKVFRYRFLFNEKAETKAGTQQMQLSYLATDYDYIAFGSDDTVDSTFEWFALDFDYHLLAFTLDRKEPMILTTKEYKIHDKSEKEDMDYGVMKLTSSNSSNTISYSVLFVKKDYEALKNSGNGLHLSVDFGWFRIIAEPLLYTLKYINGYISNWGISIIILTILLKILLLPVQYKQVTGMKKMQKLSPKMKEIRERYKDDPQRLQQENMKLFKDSGHNPLAGCFPMIFQIPIFIALFNVLRSAVELVDAPFYFWITDLSVADPYYVLPILFALGMVIHQKITPMTITDPNQKKMMMAMPVIFSVMMVTFPSGLLLYTVTNTYFGIFTHKLIERLAD